MGGLGIVLLAILLDRITQAMGQPRRGVRHWWQSGPVGLVARSLRKPESTEPATSTDAAQGANQPQPAAAH